jgi:hypothetical protein
MRDHNDTPEGTGNKGKQVQLKKKLMNSWDQMKQKYPVVRSMELVGGDPDKEEFLRTIDGLKSAEEIGAYFTLEPSEAHLILSDLLQLGAIRFIEDAERLGYLKKQNLELKQKFDFQMAERNRLLGEELYLTKRIKEKKKATAELKERLPEVNESLEEHELNLASLRQNYNALATAFIHEFQVQFQNELQHILGALRMTLGKLLQKSPQLCIHYQVIHSHHLLLFLGQNH